MKKIGIIVVILGLLAGGFAGYLFYRADKAERIGRSMTRSNYGSRLGRRILLRLAKKRREKGTLFGGGGAILLIGGVVMISMGNRKSVQVSAAPSEKRGAGPS